jgi:SAM-dependent methyltransferase
VGTRTFAIAPVIEKLFQKLNPTPEIHGFEVDAYRRFTNLRTRADYGQYYSRKVKNGYYHAGDFRSTEKKFDMIFNLHPFVTETAHVAWGLPLKVYDPVGLFSHCHRSLAHSGLFLLSSPNEEEYVRALNLSASVGFNLIEEKKWFPTPGSSQKQPRHGALFIK